MDPRDDETQRMPLPSEDEGDLTEAPAQGVSDDPMVATEEGVPYAPPTERVLAAREPGAPAARPAGAPRDADEELETQPDLARDEVPEPMPADEALLNEALTALRRSDVTAGDRVRLDATGSTIIVRGAVESIAVADEILGIVGAVRGVNDVVDELEITAT